MLERAIRTVDAILGRDDLLQGVVGLRADLHSLSEAAGASGQEQKNASEGSPASLASSVSASSSSSSPSVGPITPNTPWFNSSTNVVSCSSFLLAFDTWTDQTDARRDRFDPVLQHVTAPSTPPTPQSSIGSLGVNVSGLWGGLGSKSSLVREKEKDVLTKSRDLPDTFALEHYSTTRSGQGSETI